MLVHHVHQLNHMVVAVLGIFLVGKSEVHHAHHINVVEVEIPFLALFGLVSDGLGRVKQAAVLEIALPCVLHLNDEVAPVLRLAIYVEVTVAAVLVVAQLLNVLVG